MKKRNIIMAAAAAMAMAAGATSASALTITESLFTNTAVQHVSVNSTAAQKKFVATGVVRLAIPGEAAVVGKVVPATLQKNDVVTITVKGAKFDRAKLSATPVATTGGAVITWVLDATNTILTGTVGTGSTVTAAGAAGTAVNMDLTAAYDLTGVASGTKVTIDASVSRNVLGQNQVVHKLATGTAPITDVLVTPSLQKISAVTATPATATVASSFVKFDAAATNVTAAAVTLPTTSWANSTLDDYNAAAATGTLFVKLTGVPSNATKVDWAIAGISQSDAKGTAAPAKATAAGNFWLDGAGNGYAKLTAAASKAVITAKPLVVTVDGKAAISPSTVKMTIDYIAGAGDKFVSHQVLAATDMITITRNGSSFSVNASGPLNTIKITDMSGSLTASTGKISVSAYDATGAVAPGTAPVIPSLKSNGTQTIAMSTLTTAFPTAVRFDFVVESTQIVASNVKKSATGTTVTTYRNSTDSKGAIAGNGAL